MITKSLNLADTFRVNKSKGKDMVHILLLSQEGRKNR